MGTYTPERTSHGRCEARWTVLGADGMAVRCPRLDTQEVWGSDGRRHVYCPTHANLTTPPVHTVEP
jgi:hypothetical protein